MAPPLCAASNAGLSKLGAESENLMEENGYGCLCPGCVGMQHPDVLAWLPSVAIHLHQVLSTSPLQRRLTKRPVICVDIDRH